MSTPATTVVYEPPPFAVPAPALALVPPAPVIPASAVPVPTAPLRIDALRMHDDGNPITHLSKSSFETFAACPEQWRRRYVLGEKTPSQPRMVLGNMVDGALTWLAEQRIAGELPELGDLRDQYRKYAIPAAIEREKLGVTWGSGDDSLDGLRVLGWKAILAYLRGLEPYIGRATAAQRKLEFKLAPAAEWCVQGYLDLEAVTRELVAVNPENGELIRYEGTPEPVAVAVEGTYVPTIDPKTPRGRDYLKANGIEHLLEERLVDEIVDYKVVNKAPTAVGAADDTQVTVYLAGRQIEGRPADRFRLAAMCKPTKTLGFRTKLISSYRGQKGLNRSLAQFANMARSVNAFWREFGPYEPWAYADAKAQWRCSPKFCDHHANCAGGAGF
jgi:hypothetical protein